MQLQAYPICPGRLQRRIERAAGVDDQDVAGVKKLHDLAESGMYYSVVRKV